MRTRLENFACPRDTGVAFTRSGRGDQRISRIMAAGTFNCLPRARTAGRVAARRFQLIWSDANGHGLFSDSGPALVKGNPVPREISEFRAADCIQVSREHIG